MLSAVSSQNQQKNGRSEFGKLGSSVILNKHTYLTVVISVLRISCCDAPCGRLLSSLVCTYRLPSITNVPTCLTRIAVIRSLFNNYTEEMWLEYSANPIMFSERATNGMQSISLHYAALSHISFLCALYGINDIMIFFSVNH